MCKMEYVNMQTGEKLDCSKVEQLMPNAMLKVRPDLWIEWDFDKNDELGLDIWKMTKGSKKKAWWICEKYNKSYHQLVNNKVVSNACKICCGKYIIKETTLAFLNPQLASEWHPNKNGDLTPHDVTCSFAKKIWWVCEKGHEWKIDIHTRNAKKHGCPYCVNQKVLKGYNDMWTTNPTQASWLLNPEDGYKYMEQSNKKLDWKCPDCGEVIEDKQIGNVKHKGLSCPRCSDGMSYPEKFMYNLLKELGIEFVKELSSKHFKWIDGKRYDFYVPSLNLIIETHGIQHGKENGRGRTLKEEQDNDRLKRETALSNGIEHYIELNCYESNTEYIISSILNSDLNSILKLKNVNWQDITVKSEKSIVFNVCELWSNGSTVGEIMNMTMLCKHTVRNYLIRGNKMGICNYNKKESRERSNSRGVVQLTLDNEYIKSFSTMGDAVNELNVWKTSISACCRGKQKSTGGYKWLYKEDYENSIK